MPARGPVVELDVAPPCSWKIPARGRGDGLTRVRSGVISRLLAADGAPVLVRAWKVGGQMRFRAEPAGARGVPGADADRLAWAVDRLRFAVGIDEDFRPLFRQFRADPLLGPSMRRQPWWRPRRHPTVWEAFAWAVTEQLIESTRAATIQRRITGRWGTRMQTAAGVLRDGPSAAAIAALPAPALAACDLAPKRAQALVRVAGEVHRGRIDLADPADDARLLAQREIGPWTVQCLGLLGRGEPDSLPAGDLAYVKLVGRLARLGRRATVEEVEEFFAPYEPYRGLAGLFCLIGHASGRIPA
ncbi:MAG: DNA-3-methyladenine glycosylase family protein [Solirubrobacterales bacterium]